MSWRAGRKIFAGLLAASCLLITATAATPQHIVRKGTWELASWYSPADSGGGLACTGRSYTGWYGYHVIEAASRTLPCGTRLLITVRNGNRWRSVVVKILDRGPYIYSRQLDLSAGAVIALGFPGGNMSFGVRYVLVRRL